MKLAGWETVSLSAVRMSDLDCQAVKLFGCHSVRLRLSVSGCQTVRGSSAWQCQTWAVGCQAVQLLDCQTQAVAGELTRIQPMRGFRVGVGRGVGCAGEDKQVVNGNDRVVLFEKVMILLAENNSCGPHAGIILPAWPNVRPLRRDCGRD